MSTTSINKKNEFAANLYKEISKDFDFGTNLFTEISPEISENDNKEMIIELVRQGKLSANTIGAIIDAHKAYEEQKEKEQENMNRMHNIYKENAGNVAGMLNAVTEFGNIGFNIRIVEDYYKFTVPTNDFTILVNVGGFSRDVHWYRTFVEVPAELIEACLNRAIEKYGAPLMRQILDVYHKGGTFFEGTMISTKDVVTRGNRLVATLHLHGWNAAMTEYEFDNWLDRQPAGWLAVLIRAIMSGATGHVTCINCENAIFDDSGYVRCRRCRFEVPIRDNKFDTYIEFAKRKEVSGNIVLSDIVRDVTHDCSVKRAVGRREACRLQALARKHNK